MRRSFNHIWMLCLLLTVTLFASTSCSDDESDGQVAATLTSGKATSHSLSFTITPQHAEKCAWVCVKKGETVPVAEDILSGGVPVDVSQTTQQMAIALEAKTDYTVIAAVMRNGRNVLSAPLEMSTLEKTEIPEEDNVLKLRVVVEATYSTDNAQGVGNYALTFATAEPGQDGYPAKVGDSMLLLDFYNAADADPINATLPSGDYLPKGDNTAFTWNPAYSMVYTRIGAGPQGAVATLLSNGTVTVEREGDIYDIQINAVNAAGKEIRAHYTGPILFVLTGTSKYERFNTPQDVTFETANGRYYGNWSRPHSDDWSLQFYQGTFDDKNKFVDGYELILSLVYANKLSDYNVPIPILEEGTYKVNQKEVFPLSSIPFTLDKGGMETIWGQVMPAGSYLRKVDASTGKEHIGFVTSGTMKIVNSGDQYEIQFDFISEENITMKGVFSGTMKTKNFNDNDNTLIPRPWSKLTENVQLQFPDDAIATATYLGDYLYPGLNSWFFLLSSEKNDKGDMITTEFFTPREKGMQLVPGTYTVSRKFEAYQLMPGFQQYGGGPVNYTWYGDLSTQDDEGYSSKLGPVEEGTMVIEKNGDNYRFVFDFIDDAGHTIKGEWTGPVDIGKHESADTRAKKSMRSFQLKKH